MFATANTVVFSWAIAPMSRALKVHTVLETVTNIVNTHIVMLCPVIITDAVSCGILTMRIGNAFLAETDVWLSSVGWSIAAHA